MLQPASQTAPAREIGAYRRSLSAALLGRLDMEEKPVYEAMVQRLEEKSRAEGWTGQEFNASRGIR